MKRIKVIALALAIVIMAAVPAWASYEYINVPIIDGHPGYCGWGTKEVFNSDNPLYQKAHGDIEVFKNNTNGCTSPGPDNNPRPYDNLRVRVWLHCLSASGIETVPWDSGVRRNADQTASIQATSPASNWCNGTGSPSAYPKARTVMNGCFYIYPSGWVCNLSTTHWTSPGVVISQGSAAQSGDGVTETSGPLVAGTE